MHIAFALPSPAQSGSGGGAPFGPAMAAALRGLGHRAELLHGAAPSFPPGALPVIDGMLLPGLLPRLQELAGADAVVVVHHVSAAAGRDRTTRDEVREAERQMLPRFRRIIASSEVVADQLAQEFGVAAPHVVLPGAHDLPRSAAPDCRILSAGVLTPRKGHDRLLHAMARLTDLDWHLTIAGDAGRDPAHADGLVALIPELGLGGRVTLLADPTEAGLDSAWSTASLFALATRWEAYASGVAEALRRGIPAVVTQGGGSGALLTPETGAVCAPDDPATFGKVLRRLIFDGTLRAGMAEAAWQAGRRLPGWDQQARAFETILKG